MRLGNTAWEPAIKSVSLTWKPSGSDIKINYVNALGCFMKKFQPKLSNAHCRNHFRYGVPQNLVSL